MHKIPKEYRFWDISDYARPIAIMIAKILKNTTVRAIHITLLYFFTGLIAVYTIVKGLFTISAILIMLKNILDAVDGSLARLQRRPSKVGRFADSIADALLNFLFTIAIALHYNCCYLEGILVFLSMSIQGSFFNYYYVKYRHEFGGDRTSSVNESAKGYPWDDEKVLKILFFMYKIIYGWQDKLVDRIDKLLFGERKIYKSKLFMTGITLFGLGIHLLILSISLLLGKPLMFFDATLFMNVLLGLFLILFVPVKVK